MDSVSSDDECDGQSERLDDDYRQSADISESETSSTSTFTCHPNVASTSQCSSSSSSPLDIVSSEVELMKERFSKLLLGEDISGGGKGVNTALAISNAITNLAVTVFGNLWKLEPLAPEKKLMWHREIDWLLSPLAPEKKLMWHREIDWLLSVSDSIVELIPSVQEFPDGGTFEVMVTQQRSDLYINLPALKKIDTILINILDGFSNSDFCYVDRGVLLSEGEHIEGEYASSSSSGGSSVRLEEKCWLPFPRVPPNGLSDSTRKQLQHCRECTNQIFKAALAINTDVLSDMEVPKVYLDCLPKSGKAWLGDVLYRYITEDQFSPESLVDYLDISSEYTTLEIVNRIKDAVLMWKQRIEKNRSSHSSPFKSSWGVAVKGLVSSDVEKNRLLAERGETLLKSLKLHFPGLPQSSLDMNKIKHNKDVGHSILESYSRVMESLAYNLMSRIDDLLYVDEATKRRSTEMMSRSGGKGSTEICTLQKRPCAAPLTIQLEHCTSSRNEVDYHSRVPKDRRSRSLHLVNKTNPGSKQSTIL